MERTMRILENLPLFHGIDSGDLKSLLQCLAPRLSHHEKGEIIYLAGENTHSFGIVLSGQVQVYQEDYYGNKSIFANLNVGDMFGESFACAEIKRLPVSVVTTAESELLFIDCRRLAAPCQSACSFHGSLIRNMLNIIAMKNIELTQKIEITSRRTTREKLLAFLSAQAQRAGGSQFVIPFDRQELADYLGVDRSAMSAELGRLRDSGVLRFNKNQFELL